LVKYQNNYNHSVLTKIKATEPKLMLFTGVQSKQCKANVTWMETLFRW